jgi:glycosyltransferase involved in cell wall biosynthesis
MDSDARLLRTGMMAERLTARGHEVHWWTSAFEHQQKRFISVESVPWRRNGLTIHPLRGIGYRSNVSVRRYIDHLSVANRFRVAALEAKCPDIIVASVPCHHLAFEAAKYATTRRVPLIVDVRDPWPEIFLDRVSSRWARTVLRFILSNDFRRTRRVLSQANSVVAVSDGYLRWARTLGNRGSDRDRVFMIGYDPEILNSRSPLPSHTELWMEERSFTHFFVFVGTFGRSYELNLVLEVARHMQRAGRNDVSFVIAGSGELQKSIEIGAQGLSNVHLAGWLTRPQISNLLSQAYAGLVPCRSTLHTVPNKPFEYLAAGLPLISSLQGEFADLVKDRSLGLNYQPSDANGLEACVARLIDTPELHESLSRNCQRFFESNCDARQIYLSFADYIESIATSDRSDHSLSSIS